MRQRRFRHEQSATDRLAAMERESKRVDRATLEHPELPDCMRDCARKRLKRLEETKWKAGPQKTLPLSTND